MDAAQERGAFARLSGRRVSVQGGVCNDDYPGRICVPSDGPILFHRDAKYGLEERTMPLAEHLKERCIITKQYRKGNLAERNTHLMLDWGRD